MSIYDTTSLIDNIQNNAFVPISQNTFTNANILKLCDLEISSFLVPMIMQQRADYFLSYQDFVLVTEQTTPNPYGYPIPTNAVGAKIDYVTIIDTSGTERKVPFIATEDVPYNNTSFSLYNQVYFFFRGNKVYLTGNTNNTNGTLRLYYFYRPNQLVETTAVATVTGIDTLTNTFTVNQVPSTMITGTVCDLIQGNPHFDILGAAQPIVTVGANSITFTAIPATMGIGDYVCLQGQTAVPQIPFELQVVLALRCARTMLQASGDQAGSTLINNHLIEIEKMALTLIAPRAEGENMKIVNLFNPLDQRRRPNRFGNY